VRGCQVRTDVLASFPRWDMFLRRFYDGMDISLGFLNGTAAPARFPCFVKIYLQSFQDGMDIPAWFPDWGIYSCEVARLGQIFLPLFQDGICSCEVSMMG